MQNRVSAEFVLPCGCMVSKYVVLEVDAEGGDKACKIESYRRQLEHAGDMLADWFESQCHRHKCELVADHNPYGLSRSQ